MPRPRAVPHALLAGLIASDSEPDLDAFDESDTQAARTASVVKKPRGRSVSTTRVTKPAPRATRRTSDGAAAVGTSPKRTAKAGSRAGAGRGARKTQQSNPDETVQVGDVDPPQDVLSTATKKPRGRPPRSVPESASKTKAEESTILVPASTIKRRGRPPKQLPVLPEEIPETQPEDPMQLDIVAEEVVVEEEEEEEEEQEVAPAINPLDVLYDHDLSDVALRRRLGDLTKKYNSLEMRHQDLRDVGVKEAEQNYERLRKQADARTAAANKLIAELKAELAAQTALAEQGEQLRQQLEASEIRADNLQGTIEEMDVSLGESKAEIKTLSTKLAAFRAAEPNARVPGSAIKTSAASNPTAQAKEDLYADLTGLIVRGLKQENEEDIFDCIQTGRNGTLHFKLAIENVDVGESYDDVSFTYRPQLDSSRDQGLIDILPDFLVEEITFSRPQASRFYARVIKSLTEAPPSG